MEEKEGGRGLRKGERLDYNSSNFCNMYTVGSSKLIHNYYNLHGASSRTYIVWA